MKYERGLGLPTAIFLLVILALLGAFMVSLSSSQSITSAQDIQGTRAYLAARGGMERALFSLKSATSCPAFPALTVDGFAVSISCAAFTHDEGGTSKYIFRVVSTATAGGAIGSLGRVERTVSASIEF